MQLDESIVCSIFNDINNILRNNNIDDAQEEDILLSILCTNTVQKINIEKMSLEEDLDELNGH